MKHKILNFLIDQNYLYLLAGKIYFRKFKFKTINKKKFDAFWGELLCQYSMEVPLDNVVAILNSPLGYKKIKLEESPHYKLIKSFHEKKELEVNDYKKYYTEYFPDENLETKINYFTGLYTNISENNENLFVCVKKELSSFSDNNFKIIDGLHRACIARSLGIKKIKVYIVDSING